MAIDAGEIARAYLALRGDYGQLQTDLGKARSYFASQIDGMQRMANSLTLGAGLTGGLVGLGLGKASSVAADFEQAMIEAGVAFDIYNTKGSDTFENLKNLALRLGQTTKFSAREAAEALSIFGQAGFTAEQAMAALPDTLASAAANNVKIADAAELASAVLRSMGKSTSDLAHVNDAMTVAAAQSAAGFQDMAYSLKYAAPVAKQTKTSLEELLAMIARLADSGIKGELAGTALRGAIIDLASPSKAARAELDRLGISTDLLGKKEGAFLDILKKLQDAEIDLGTSEKIFGVQQAGPILNLINAIDADGRKGVHSLRALVAAMNDVSNVGIAGKKAGALASGTKGQRERLSSSIEALGVRVGEPLNQALAPAIDGIIARVDRLSEFISLNGTVFEKWASQLGNIAVGTESLLDRAWSKVFNADKAGGGFQVILDALESLTTDWDLQWAELVANFKISGMQIAKVVDDMSNAVRDFLGIGEDIGDLEQVRLEYNERLFKSMERQRDILRQQLEINQFIRNVQREVAQARAIGQQVDRDVKNMRGADPEGLRLIEMINHQKAWPAMEAVRNMIPAFAGGNMWNPGAIGPGGMNLVGGGLGMAAEQLAKGVGKSVEKGMKPGQLVGLTDLHKQIQSAIVSGSDPQERILKDQLEELKGIRGALGDKKGGGIGVAKFGL